MLPEDAACDGLLLERLGRSLHQLGLPWNAIEASEGLKLVDPDGLLAEANYDLGILMHEDPVEFLAGDARNAHERARWLARRRGLDATAIWEWGAVEPVSTGLLGVKVGLEPGGRQMLAVAEGLAG